MKKIKLYLKEVCKHIKKKNIRHETYKELRAHYALKVECISEKYSVTEEEAESIVLKKAEPAKKLGKKIRFANEVWYLRKPLILFSACTTVVALVALVLTTYTVMHTKFLPSLTSQKSISENQYALIEKDLKLLQEKPIFKLNKRKHNAHFFLKDYFTRSDAKKQNDKVKDFFSKYRSWSLNKKTFESVLNSKELKEFNISWIEKIYEFDHWNYFEDPKTIKEVQRVEGSDSIKKIGVLSSYDILEMNLFFQWATIYAFKKIKEDKPLEGLKLLNHSIQLINSTRGLIGQSVAVIGLKVENQLADLSNVKWRVTPNHIAQAYKRVSWGWAGLMQSFSTNIERSKKWEQYMSPGMGMCSGVSESVLGMTVMEVFFYRPWPFELDLNSEMGKNRVFQKKLLAKCDFHELMPLLTPQKKALKLWDKESSLYYTVAENSFTKLLPNPLSLPYVRQLYGYGLMSVGIPNYIKAVYKDTD